MKSYRQKKRKRGDISTNQDECTGVNIKKPANETGQAPQSSLESIRMSHLDPPIQVQIPSIKIKLQLFPINEQTRLGLEKDGHNPFLELTLRAKKRISSVVRHLNAKWSCSSTVAGGQLMLFPYNTKLEQLASSRRWTLNDSALTAWEVYIDVGNPSIFRLRYGWLCNLQPEIFGKLRNSSFLEAHDGSEGKKGSPRILEIPNHQEEQLDGSCEDNRQQDHADDYLHSDVNELKASDEPTGLVDDKVTTETDPVPPTVPWDDNLTMLSIGGLLSEISLQGKINGSLPSSVSKSSAVPVGQTSDINIRDLLSEDSLFRKMTCTGSKLDNESSFQPFFLGSSDVSIGGLFSEASLHAKNKSDAPPMEAGHVFTHSPWDDNLTTLSIGGLLSEVSLQAKIYGKVDAKESKSSLEPFAPFQSLQSLDSLISGQLFAPSQKAKPSAHEPSLSILDAEETCHAFPIQKLQSNRDTTSSCSNDASSKQSHYTRASKAINGTVFPKDSSREGFGTDILSCSVGTFDEDSRIWPFRHQSAGAG